MSIDKPPFEVSSEQKTLMNESWVETSVTAVSTVGLVGMYGVLDESLSVQDYADRYFFYMRFLPFNGA